MFRKAKGSEYLAIAGNDVNDIKLTRSAYVSSNQTCTVVDMSPVNNSFEVKPLLKTNNALIMTDKLKPDYFSKFPEANLELYFKRNKAESEAKAQKAIADASLYEKKKEAEGLVVLSEAEAFYLRSLLDALGGNYDALKDYLKIRGGLFQEVAKINSELLLQHSTHD